MKCDNDEHFDFEYDTVVQFYTIQFAYSRNFGS